MHDRTLRSPQDKLPDLPGGRPDTYLPGGRPDPCPPGSRTDVYLPGDHHQQNLYDKRG